MLTRDIIYSRFIDKRDFQACSTDTDSFYCALSGKLEDIIKPDLRQRYFCEYGRWFPREYCDSHMAEFIDAKTSGDEWSLRECCKEVSKYDRRTPGLFKGKGREKRNSSFLIYRIKRYISEINQL